MTNWTLLSPPVPTAPRDVDVGVLSTTTIIISWFPPDPPNGVILDYLVQVRDVASGQVVAARTLAIGQDQQTEVQTVTVGELQLESTRYLPPLEYHPPTHS